VDALAEKLRQQRLQEAADLEHARAAFGEAGKNLEELAPRTEAEFAEFGELIYAKYFRGVERNANFRAGIKALVRGAAAALSVPDLKDLESSVIAVRNQKLKDEKEAAAKGKKSSGAKGKPTLKGDFDLEGDGSLTTALDQDDYDFM
jgi:translation initiation factor 3 subunit J